MQDDSEALERPHSGETLGVSCGAGPVFSLASDRSSGFMEPASWDEEIQSLRIEFAYLLSTVLQSTRRAAAAIKPYSRRADR